jgi:hypothetical protein
MKTTMAFALTFAFAGVPALAQNSGTNGQNNQNGQGQNSQHPFGGLGLRADEDIAYAFIFIDFTLQSQLNSSGTTGTSGTTTTTASLTTTQIKLLEDAQMNLYLAYFTLTFEGGSTTGTTYQNYIRTALNDLLSSGLVSSTDLNQSISSGQFIFASHPNSRHEIFLAIYLTAFAFFDTEDNGSLIKQGNNGSSTSGDNSSNSSNSSQ